MLMIFPVSYEYETTLTPKRLARKLDGELTEFKPTLNVLSTGKFMKKHKMESLYYGRREDNKFCLFYHKFKKHDGGETGFFGHYEQTKKGTRIYGKFRKPTYTYIFGIIWTIVALLCSLTAFALGEKQGSAVLAGIWLLGIFALFWDNKKAFLRAYIESLPAAEEESDD